MTIDELVEATFEAWNSDDVEAWIATLSPDVVYHTSGTFPGLQLSYAGHDGIREFWRAMHEPWATLRMELEQITPLDERRLVADFRFWARGAESGATVELTFSNGARIDGGLVTELYAAPNHAEAARLLGES